MKTFGQHVLILGGFYFIIFFMLNFFDNMFLQTLSFGILIGLLVMILLLCFKKEFAFISKLQDKYSKSSNYLMALGVAQYFSIIFAFIPGAVYGYKAANAEYLGIDYSSVIPQYLYVVSYIYLAVLILSLGWATYKSFAEKK